MKSQKARNIIFLTRQLSVKPQKVPSIYDTSARPNDKSPSLIKCLKPGSSLHQLRSVLVRNPFHLSAFRWSQGEISACPHKRSRTWCPSFLLAKGSDSKESGDIEVYEGIIRAVYITICSWMRYRAAWHGNNLSWRSGRIRHSLYVGDLISGGKKEKTGNLKNYVLPSFQAETSQVEAIEPSYVDDQLGDKPGDTILSQVFPEIKKRTVKVSFSDQWGKSYKMKCFGDNHQHLWPAGYCIPDHITRKNNVQRNLWFTNTLGQRI